LSFALRRYHFLKVNSTDPTWLARFPMTKAVVKALCVLKIPDCFSSLFSTDFSGTL
jgi:hypothetical protein